MEIEGDGYHIAVIAYINGRKARMLIDTGASRTVFDSTRIMRFLKDKTSAFTKNQQLSAGLGTTTLESHSTSLSSFRLGDYRIKPYQAILLDLSNINHSYALIGLAPIDGVIGSDLLKQLKATISFSKKYLSFSF